MLSDTHDTLILPYYKEYRTAPCKKKNTDRLIIIGLDEQHRDNSGWTPLHYAAFEGHIDVCEALLEAGAKIDEADNDGKGALMLAAQEGHTTLVERLIEQHCAPIDQHAHDGKTALRYEIIGYVLSCFSILICVRLLILYFLIDWLLWKDTTTLSKCCYITTLISTRRMPTVGAYFTSSLWKIDWPWLDFC